MKTPVGANSAETEFITTAEAATRLGRSRRQVLNLVAKGTLRARRYSARIILIEATSLAAAKDVRRGRPGKKITASRFAARLRRMGKPALADAVELVCGKTDG